MTISIMTITVCAIIIILAIVTPMCNGLFRKPHRDISSHAPELNIPLSIVITAHDNAGELERNLPLILSQDYKPGFEVIVVNESSTNETEDVLKRLKAKYPNLYTTFIPESSHYLSRKKLALTIGVKAAHNEWIIFTDTDCKPHSDKWLRAMSGHCDDKYNLVLGYTRYEQTAPKYYRFERMLTSCYQLRKAQKGTACCYNGNNLAMRKSTFMAHNGFLKNLKYLRGEYDFIVNEYALPGQTSVAIEQDAHICQDQPYGKQWTSTHVYHIETRRHLMHNKSYRLLINTDTIMLHFNYLIQMAIVVYSVYVSNWLTGGVAMMAFLITVILRAIIASNAMKFFGESIPLWTIPFMEIRGFWQNLVFILKHKKSDKYDFIRR